MGEQVGQGCGTTLRDPAVMAFVRSAVEVAEPYEAFCGRPLPSGLSREDAWELVTFSRRLSGWPSVMGDPADPLGGSYWTVPCSIVPHLVDTVQKTGASSRLWEELRRLERQPVVTRVLLEDVQAACLRDGLDVEYERLRAVVVHGEAPLLPEERVVSNLVGLVRDLPGSRRDTGSLSGLIGTAIVPGLLQDVDEMPGRSRLLSPSAVDPRLLELPAEVRMRNLADILDRPDTWGDFAFLGQIMASESFFELLPLERGNALVELVVRHVGFARLGVPALGYAPLSKIRLDWELGTLPPAEVFASHGKALVSTPFGTDSTWALCQYAVFFDRWLARMERDLAQAREEHAAWEERVDADQRLNLRQRELLKTLGENPSGSVDVRGYEGRFGVAMSTANTDLAKLAALGYLEGSYEGKRQVYRLR